MSQKYKFILGLLFFFSTFPFANYAACPEIPKLTLSAQAILHKPADELQLKVGVVTLGDTAESTVAENSAKMQAVIDSLEAAGLCSDDYETGLFSIHPTFTPYPKNPPQDSKPSINGYEVSNSINIHTDKLDMAGKLIDVANKAGANSISDIRFGLKDPREYRTEAIHEAAAHAASDAQTLAMATQVRLVRVLSISLDNTQVNTPKVSAAYVAKAMNGEASLPIEPGEVTITVSVSLVCEIASN